MATAVPLELDDERPDEPDISQIVTEDDAPLDNFPSERQQRLLVETLYASWSGPPPDEDGASRPFLAAANVGVFSTPSTPPLVPDVLVSLDVRLREPIWDKPRARRRAPTGPRRAHSGWRSGCGRWASTRRGILPARR